MADDPNLDDGGIPVGKAVKFIGEGYLHGETGKVITRTGVTYTTLMDGGSVVSGVPRRAIQPGFWIRTFVSYNQIVSDN